MSLDYELTGVSDYKTVCYEETEDGKFKMSVPCYTAIHLAMAVGIPCLETDEDVAEYYFRAKAFEMAGLTVIYESDDNVEAGWPQRRNHTLKELKELKGLRTNVSRMTRTAFVKSLMRAIEREAELRNRTEQRLEAEKGSVEKECEACGFVWCERDGAVITAGPAHKCKEGCTFPTTS